MTDDKEREAVVRWLLSEAGKSRQSYADAPSDDTIFYLTRALYYEQAAAFISRGEHRKDEHG